MLPRLGILVTLVLAGSRMLPADTILFGLLGDPNQNYTFTRTDTPVSGSEYSGWQVTVPSGPYPGWLGADTQADENYFFCVSFTLTATFGGQYSGTLTTPSTQQQVEAAYLDSLLYTEGGFNTPLGDKGPISMAIWQIMDPTPGDVPRDPAAQPLVNLAVDEYNAGNITPAMFSRTEIFVPANPSIQTFMMEAPAAAAEPGTVVLFACGLTLLLLGVKKRKHCPR
jgi:hypothetical protein